MVTGIRVNVPLFGNSTSGLFVKYKMAAKSFPKVIFLYRSKNKTSYQNSLSMHAKFQSHIFKNNRVIVVFNFLTTEVKVMERSEVKIEVMSS